MVHGYLFSRPPGISGTVYGVSCGKTTCSRGGLGGIKVLVKGPTTDGTPVEKTAKTNSSGKWSAAVPPGNTGNVGKWPVNAGWSAAIWSVLCIFIAIR